MKGTNRIKLVSVFLAVAYLLSACSGTAPQSGSPVGGGKPLANDVAFTGTVESVNAGEITVSGQVVAIDAASIVDPNIQIGDIVKVEAQVTSDGAVIALRVESFGADDANTNSDDGNVNDTNANDGNSNANTNDDNSNTGADNSNGNDNGTGGTEQEVTGMVSAISAASVTVDGVEYKFDASTEIKDPIFAGDTVKLHVMVGADGSLTVREIEKVSGTDIGDDNSNDDDSNDDNGNDDNSNDDDSNDDNSNDDDSNDDNSNSGSNSNGG